MSRTWWPPRPLFALLLLTSWPLALLFHTLSSAPSFPARQLARKWAPIYQLVKISRHPSFIIHADCRKTSYPPAVPIITTVDVDRLSKGVSKDYARKMRQWHEDRDGVIQQQKKEDESVSGAGPGLIRRMSQKGQQIKRGWLRKPKCDGGSTVDDQSSGRYFEKDDGRQNTVVENDVAKTNSRIGWSASDTDISRRSTLGPILGGKSRQFYVNLTSERCFRCKNLAFCFCLPLPAFLPSYRADDERNFNEASTSTTAGKSSV